MGTPAYDRQTTNPDIFLALGFKETRIGAARTPRALSLLSSHLEKSVQKSEILLETRQVKDIITIFHGSKAPDLSVRQYVERIFKYAGCSPSCFIVAQIYLDRYLQQVGICLTSFNVHRLLITGVMVAAKYMDDAYFNNAYYAKVGGVRVPEMNRLEMQFLFGIDFRLRVTVETFMKYCLELEREASGGIQIERPIRACGIEQSWSSKDDATCAPAIAR